MKITINDTKYELNNDKLDRIFNEQKKYITDLMKEAKKTEDFETALLTLFSLTSISEEFFYILLNLLKEDKIVEIVQATEIEEV